jgi:putative flavoprotein involved in K+ transport
MRGVIDGLPVLEDVGALEVANVIWCTGFGNGLSWIDLPIFETDGEPRHQSGIASDEPGLYFVGLHFLHAFSSTMIHGIARDAERIAGEIDRRTKRAAPGTAVVTSEKNSSSGHAVLARHRNIG